ncbi:hypothetical protein AM592_12225 [Bacillus gobiensis]|uniref:Probable membrane transporter protein n=2 Tax=Bacillus TaxID=1386 RepID=A0A0M4FRP7_9BACI|nr:hypothetical protein AM592_12225 [Bacillus gobiensis]MBP1081112.1 putative membrane protein YfcA [Bacillus capparidis]
MIVIIIMLILGVLAGMIGSLVGLGGGILIVPALTYLAEIVPAFHDVTPQIAIGTSLFVIIFTGLSSTLSYMKYKLVDYKSGLIFFIGSGTGSVAGAYVSKGFHTDSFSLWFGIFMIAISLSLMLKRNQRSAEKKHVGMIRAFQENDGTVYTYSYRVWIGISIALVVGFLGGLFGIGGGSLMVPAMILLFMFPPRVAIATSMFIIFLSSITGSIAHIASGHVNWLFALCLVPGAWYGGKLGAYINRALKNDILVIMMRWVLVIIGLRMIFQAIF